MMSGIELINYSIVLCGVLISVMGFLLTLFLRRMDDTYRNFFLLFFSLLIAYTVSGLVDEFSRTVAISRISLFLHSLFSSLLVPPFTLYFLRRVGKSGRKNWLYITISALWVVYFLLLVFTQFSTLIYYFTPDNEYHRGPWYLVLLIPPTLQMILNLVELQRYSSALTQRQRRAFLIYFAVPMICMLIQMFFYGIRLIVLGTATAVLFMFIFHTAEYVERIINQERENARQQANISVLQMRPHFIYNTLISIYYLCKQDADKAQRVIMDFSRYLKKNFTAIVSEDTIPFTEELQHVQAYLAVEKARYEENLFVTFDTPVTMFKLPPLTLQPIVENAVKHGLSPDLDPLHLSVTTRESENGVTILVEDTGVGYTPANDNEPHIALANIRERLKFLCGGELTIRPREGGGTVVTVTLPNSISRN